MQIIAPELHTRLSRLISQAVSSFARQVSRHACLKTSARKLASGREIDAFAACALQPITYRFTIQLVELLQVVIVWTPQSAAAGLRRKELLEESSKPTIEPAANI